MKKKFFFRRAAHFFVLMLIPTLVLFALFLAYAVTTASSTLMEKGQQTVEAAADNCGVMLGRTSQQNDLLTSTTRMNVSLKRALNQTDMTYGDSVFMTALGSMVRSTIDSNPPLDTILIWLDGAPRIFSSEGSSIQPVAQLKDQAWMEIYQQMPPAQRERLMISNSPDGKQRVTSIRRLLLQKGCTVVHINRDKWIEKLTTLLQRDHEHLLVVNNENEVLLHAAAEHDVWKPDAELLQKFINAAPGSWFKTEYGRYMVSRVKMDLVTVLAVVPLDALTATVSMMRQTFLAILLVNVCVVMVLAYVTTRRICSQMTLMIDMLDNAVKGLPVERPERKQQDEYDVIMNNILYMYLRDAFLRSELQQKQYEQEHAELMALQLQINPHFLYNTLQSLDMTIRGGKADRFDICDIIGAISGILKYALSSPQEPVSLRDEIYYLKEYAAVQKFRFGGRFVLYYEVDDELLDAQVFRLMLQPLVENSMLHGLKGLSERGYIWVRAYRDKDDLHISVKDSGTGMEQEELEALLHRIRDAASRSIGLTNLNRRLLLRYGEKSALNIVSEPGKGTEISFTLPYEPMPQKVSSVD